MNAIVKVDFHGDTLFAEPQEDGVILVAVKPIVDQLGIDWEGQRQRIQRDEILREGACMIKVPSPGGPQETVALPLHLIAGFLFGIDDSRIEDPDKRAAVLAYKRECHEVLYRHFFGRHDEADAYAGQPLSEVNTKLRQVEIATNLGGRSAGRRMWRMLGLLDVPEIDGFWGARRTSGKAVEGLDTVREFLADCTVESPGATVQASHLYAAYEAWAKRTGVATPLPHTSFGNCLNMLGLAKDRGRVYMYRGIRLKHISETLG